MTGPIDPSLHSSAFLTGSRRALDTTPAASLKNARAADPSKIGEPQESSIALLGRAADRLTRARAAASAAASASSELDQTGTLLADLRASLADQSRTGRTPIDAHAEAQQRIDAIVRSLETIANATITSPGTRGFVATNLSPFVADVHGSSTLPPGTSFDVEVEVLTSATTGFLQLDFGQRDIDLGGVGDGGNDHQFVIRIEGSLGARELSFASGTSIADIQASIQSFAAETGVQAIVNDRGRGLELRSTEVGGDQFVSVEVLDSGDITQGQASGAEGDLGAFTETGATFEGRGVSVQGRINGIDAESTGAGLRLATDAYAFTIDLSPQGYSTTNQPFKAFRFVATGNQATSTGKEPLDAPLPRAVGEEISRLREARPEEAPRGVESMLERLRSIVAEQHDQAAIESTRAESLLRSLLSERAEIDLRA